MLERWEGVKNGYQHKNEKAHDQVQSLIENFMKGKVK